MSKNTPNKSEKTAILSNPDVMVEVATLYYLEGLRQEDIAKRLGLSRSAISHVLSNAKARGIVEISVSKPDTVDHALGDELAKAFALKEAVLIQSPGRSPERTSHIVAEEAVNVLNRSIRRNSVVGIGWGKTIHHLVYSYAPEHELYNVSVVPLMGETDVLSESHQQNELVRLFAQRAGARAGFVYAPCYPQDEEDRRRYLETAEMRHLSRQWESLDIAVAGIGAPSRLGQTVPKSYLYEPGEKREQREITAVGDICVRLVDIYGSAVHTTMQDLVIGIPLEILRRVPRVIAVAGGEEKAGSILGVLRTGVVDVLVSDSLTAQKVLELGAESGIAR
jgi:deoxyribonucleoside regulator